MKKSCLILFLAVLCAFVFGQEQSLSRNRYAFVVGNAHYSEYPLKTNIEDAKMIASSLALKEFDVTLKTDITYSELNSELNAFINKVNSDTNSVVFFYFSGHAFTFDDENYLLSIDNGNYHTEETALEYAINLQKDVADNIYTNAQIYVLDGAYENPFRKEGSRALGIKGGLSAAKSAKESTVGFLFSAAPDALVLEPTGKTTLFANKLNEQILNSKENISDIFNNVKDFVSSETGNEQIPYSSTTTMQFAFNGNELIALQKISAQKRSDDLLSESYEIKRSYEADQVELMLQKSNAARNADEKTQRLFEEANERKRLQAEEDKRRAEEDAARASLRTYEEQAEIEAKRLEFLEAEKELKASQQKDSSVEERIENIESLKMQLNQLRGVSMNQMTEFNNEKQADLEAKIDSIRNAPLSIVEKDAEGNITPDATKRRQQKVDNAILSTNQEIDDYNKQKYKQMKEDDQKVLPLLNNAYNQLEKSTYVATSINDSLLVRVGNYNGQTATWRLHITSSFFDYENVFDEYMDLSYTDVTGSKKTDILKMTDEQLEEYNENIEIYNSLFDSSTPVFYAKLTYQIMRWKAASEYHFIPVKLEIIRLGKKTKVIRTIKGSELKTANFILYPQEEVRSAEEIKKDTERAEKLEGKTTKSAEEEEFDRLFEEDSESNEVSSNNRAYKNFYEKMKQDEEETAAKEAKTAKAAKVYSRKGRSLLSVNYGITSTDMFFPKEAAMMYSFIEDNPYASFAEVKLTTAWNQFMYGGFTLDYLFPEYGSYLNKNSAKAEVTWGGSVLTGFNISIGNNVRLFFEDNLNFDFGVVNQIVPYYKKATNDNVFGYGLGGGIDIIASDVWCFTFGYNFNWKHYMSKFSSGKEIDNYITYDFGRLIGSPDYCATSLYAGIGVTW